MADISQARNSLGYMLNVLRSFQAADKVLAALENADQVGKELALANDTARAALESITNECLAVAGRIDTLKADAAATADKLLSDAKAAAEQVRLEAAADAGAAHLAQMDAEAARDVALEQKETAEAARDDAAEEYGSLVGKISTAKEKLSALLA